MFAAHGPRRPGERAGRPTFAARGPRHPAERAAGPAAPPDRIQSLLSKRVKLSADVDKTPLFELGTMPFVSGLWATWTPRLRGGPFVWRRNTNLRVSLARSG